MSAPTHICVAANGRLVIPRQYRAQLDIEQGGKLVIECVGDQLVLKSLRAELAAVQTRLAAAGAGASGSPGDALLSGSREPTPS